MATLRVGRAYRCINCFSWGHMEDREDGSVWCKRCDAPATLNKLKGNKLDGTHLMTRIMAYEEREVYYMRQYIDDHQHCKGRPRGFS